MLSESGIVNFAFKIVLVRMRINSVLEESTDWQSCTHARRDNVQKQFKSTLWANSA